MYIHLFICLFRDFGHFRPSCTKQSRRAIPAFPCCFGFPLCIRLLKSSYIFSLSLWATNMHEVHRSSMHTSGHPALSLPPEVCTISFSATCPPEKKGTELKVDVHEIRAIQPSLHMYPESPLPSTVYTHI